MKYVARRKDCPKICKLLATTESLFLIKLILYNYIVELLHYYGMYVFCIFFKIKL